MSLWLLLMLAARSFPIYRFESESLFKGVLPLKLDGQQTCALQSSYSSSDGTQKHAPGHRINHSSNPSDSSIDDKRSQIIEDIDSNDWAVIRAKFVGPKCAGNDEQMFTAPRDTELEDKPKNKMKQLRSKKMNKNSKENKYHGEEMNERLGKTKERNDDETSRMVMKRFIFKKINKGSSKSKSHAESSNDNVSKLVEKDHNERLHEPISKSDSETHKGNEPTTNDKKVREVRKQTDANTSNMKELTDSKTQNRREIIANETSNKITKRLILNNEGEDGKNGVAMEMSNARAYGKDKTDDKQFKRFLFKKFNKKSSKKDDHLEDIRGHDAKVGDEGPKKDLKRFLFKKVNKNGDNRKHHEGVFVENDSKQKYKDNSVKEEKERKTNDATSLVDSNDDELSRNEDISR